MHGTVPPLAHIGMHRENCTSTWKDATVTYFKVLFWHLRGQIEESHGTFGMILCVLAVFRTGHRLNTSQKCCLVYWLVQANCVWHVLAVYCCKLVHKFVTSCSGSSLLQFTVLYVLSSVTVCLYHDMQQSRIFVRLKVLISRMSVLVAVILNLNM
jgi:hypothetical protein